MKTIIHVNQHKIKKNVVLLKQESLSPLEPPITVKTYKDNVYTNDAVIVDENGNELARVVYRPNNPLSCGAVCWVETKYEVKTV